MTTAATGRSSATAEIIAAARDRLAGVVDTEIPAISIVDLGLVHEVSVAGDALRVEILPTFIGCPAIEMIRTAVIEQLEPIRADPDNGLARVEVQISFAEPWTAARITEHGRAALTASGFAPPGGGPQLVGLASPATCPYCGSRRTVLENAFGPTRCRSIHYCTACRQPFEQFKDA